MVACAHLGANEQIKHVEEKRSDADAMRGGTCMYVSAFIMWTHTGHIILARCALHLDKAHMIMPGDWQLSSYTLWSLR